MEENVNLFHYLPYKKYQNFLLFFIPVILVSVISYLYVTLDQWLAGPDSMAYMEMAQSFIQGEGFSIRGSAGLDSTLLFPTGHWPPGYSILISPFILLLGMTPYYAGLTVDILCAIGSMVLIFYFYSKFLPFILTLCAGIGTIVWTQECFADVMSESPFLFFSCLSIFFLNSKCHSVKKQSFLFLLAGLVCGWTAAVRYVGIVLIIAEGLWLILHYNIKQKIIYTLSWLVGVVAAYGWLILHNISVFGAAFPHSDNVRTGSFLVKFMIGLLQFLVSSFEVKKDNLIYILLAFITFLFLIVLVIGIFKKKTGKEIPFFRSLVIFFQQNHFLLFWLLYLAGIAGISVLSFVKWSGHGAMGRFWVPVDWIKSFFVVSIAYLLFRRFYSEKTACRFTIFFFSAAMLLLVISFFIRLEKRNSGGYDYTTSDTSYLVGERGYMAQWEAAKKVSSLVSQNQLVAVGPRYDNIYWRVWGNFNSRRISDQNIAEIEEKEKSGLLWGFVVVDPEDFIKGFDEETQQKLIIPLLENPEQFPQYKVIPLSPVITAYQYIGDNP